MSKIGHGYGSEYHLLRYLGYQRGELNRKVDKATGGRLINWLDFPFSDSPKSFYHADWQGVSFLRNDGQGAGVREAWRSFWPQTGTAPSWDAVGVMDTKGATAGFWSRPRRISASSRATGGGPKAKPMIEHALTDTKEALGIAAACDWASPYYQFCNRLAVLHFLSDARHRGTLCCPSTSRATTSLATPRSCARSRRGSGSRSWPPCTSAWGGRATARSRLACTSSSCPCTAWRCKRPVAPRWCKRYSPSSSFFAFARLSPLRSVSV